MAPPLVDAATHRHRPHAVDELRGELLGEVVVHVEPVGRGARLTDVAHLGEHRAVHLGVDVGVGAHDERGVATELHRQLEHLLRRLLDQLLPDLGGPGERQLPDAAVGEHLVVIGLKGFDRDAVRRTLGG